MKPCIVTRGTMMQHGVAVPGYNYCRVHMPPHVWRQMMDARHQKIREDAMREALPKILHDLGLDKDE